MNTTAQAGMKRFLRTAMLGWAIGMGALGMGTNASASGGSGGGGSASTEPVAAGTVIRLDNFKLKYNGDAAKGTVTLGYAADGTAQSMDFSLGQINVPDGSVLPVQVITGRYHTIFSYYSYSILEYTTTPGYVVVKNKSVTLSLNKLNGDVVPDFPSPTIGTTEVRIFSPDGTIQILGGSMGKLRP